MTDRVRMFRHERGVLGSFHFGAGAGTLSADGHAIFAPAIHLDPQVIRSLVAGKALFEQLCGVLLLHQRGDAARFSQDPWTWAWGDLLVFKTGEPVTSRNILLRGRVETPDPGQVQQYLRELSQPS